MICVRLVLQNRAFQQVTAGLFIPSWLVSVFIERRLPGTSAALNAWSALNGGEISVVADSKPVSSALPNSLQFVVPSGSSGVVGFVNSGYYGMYFADLAGYLA